MVTVVRERRVIRQVDIESLSSLTFSRHAGTVLESSDGRNTAEYADTRRTLRQLHPQLLPDSGKDKAVRPRRSQLVS